MNSIPSPATLTLCSTLAFAALSSPTLAQPIEVDHNSIHPSHLHEESRYGRQVAIEDGSLIVTAQRGEAFVYDLETHEYLYRTRPISVHPDLSDGDYGNSIDSNEGRVIIGASLGTNSVTEWLDGSAYVYDIDSGDLLARFQSPGTLDRTAKFGQSVAIEGDIAVIGAPRESHNGLNHSGAAYVFDIATGNLLHTLHPNVMEIGANFGEAVAIEDGIIAVSAIYSNFDNPGDPIPFFYSYVYLFDAASGNQIAHLTNNHQESTGFGTSLDMENDILAIGSPADPTNGTYAGAVHLYQASTGTHIKTLYPEDATSYQQFGISVSYDNNILAIGANRDSLNQTNARYTGSAYLFNTTTGNQIAKIIASDGDRNDRFGQAININDGSIVIGATGYDGTDANSGGIYLFTATHICPADLTSDFALDFFDISAFLTAYAAQDPIADFNDDTLFDFFDISDFLAAYSAGCP